MMTLAEKIHQQALAFGYDGCGLIPLEDLAAYKARLDERMQTFPESAAVYGGFYDLFTNLKKHVPWAQSVLVCTIWLGKYRFPKALQKKYAKAFLLSPDTVPDSPQHQQKLAFEAWLHSEGIRFVGGEDNVPVRLFPLRQAAVAAGLGIFRKNNFFYGEKGSYYMLEGYLIDKKCEYKNEVHVRPCSEKCNLCQRACQTHCLSAPYTMNPVKCISFLTTFAGGQLPQGIPDQALGSWICGCDACQDACPNNMRINWDEGEEFPGLADLVTLMQPENIIKAADEVLAEKIIPKTECHIPKEQCNTLRICAARALRNAKGNACK